MGDSPGGGKRKKAAEDLILRTIAAHADSLLRTARRHSICVDDAQDAYQRAIELFMSHATRLDAARAPAWLHVVVKREAQAIQRARRKILMSTEVDLDGHEADSLPTPEEQLLRFDTISRSAEALKRLKPHELRALWLRAQGHSYSDISALTGWSYTKVNRCLSEGRRSFLEHYEGIESGEECARWLPVLSAMADGEATPEQLMELRPHLRNCPGCRATLRSLQDSSTPLAALLPVPLLVADAGFGDHVVQLAMRVYEGVAGGLHDRAITSFTKAQAVIEATASGKVAVVAASAAAVAGGGYAGVEQVVEQPPLRETALAPATFSPTVAQQAKWTMPMATRKPAGSPTSKPASSTATATPNEFGSAHVVRRRAISAPEFQVAPMASNQIRSYAAKPVATPPPPPPSQQPSRRRAPAAPEFRSGGTAPEFGP
jgi:RNA polymerase sigma factor (sigma-70 family)